MNMRTDYRPFIAAFAALLLASGCKPEDEGPEDTYMFAAEDASAYTQIDRSAMPGVTHAVISASKEMYNTADPSVDAAGTFVDEITAAVDGLHAALDDDLIALMLTPCATATCIGQAAPHVVPDTLKIDVAADSGFPNGRRLTDQVMDITLALLLLDLSVAPQSVTTFASLPLNPTQNDLPFDTAFPYVPAPHTP
jgi:hypothetical protein